DVRGIILTMYDARTRLADQVVEEVRSHFGSRVCETVVPRTVRLSEAPSFGQPIIVFDSTSRGAKAYRELAKEVCRDAQRRSGWGGRGPDPARRGRGGRVGGFPGITSRGGQAQPIPAPGALRGGGDGVPRRLNPRGRGPPADPRAPGRRRLRDHRRGAAL